MKKLFPIFMIGLICGIIGFQIVEHDPYEVGKLFDYGFLMLWVALTGLFAIAILGPKQWRKNIINSL